MIIIGNNYMYGNDVDTEKMDDIFEDGIVLQDDDLDLFLEHCTDEDVESMMYETGLCDNYYGETEDN